MNIDDSYFKLFQDVLVLATVIGVPTQSFKIIVQKVFGKNIYSFIAVKIFALVTGIAFCISYGLDITDLISSKNLLIGQILTGAIASEGTGGFVSIISQLPWIMKISGKSAKDYSDAKEDALSYLKGLSIEEVNNLTTDILIDKGVEFGTDLGGPQDVTNTETN